MKSEKLPVWPCGEHCPLWELRKINEGDLVRHALDWARSEPGIMVGQRDTRYMDVDMTTQDVVLYCKRIHGN